jgi:hypothetical protein
MMSRIFQWVSLGLLILPFVLGDSFEAWAAPTRTAVRRVELGRSGRNGSAPRLRARNSRSRRLNLDFADRSAIRDLPGIGEILADRIIAARRLGRGFGTIDALLSVRGLGPKSLDSIRQKITVAPNSSLLEYLRSGEKSGYTFRRFKSGYAELPHAYAQQSQGRERSWLSQQFYPGTKRAREIERSWLGRLDKLDITLRKGELPNGFLEKLYAGPTLVAQNDRHALFLGAEGLFVRPLTRSGIRLDRHARRAISTENAERDFSQIDLRLAIRDLVEGGNRSQGRVSRLALRPFPLPIRLATPAYLMKLPGVSREQAHKICNFIYSPKFSANRGFKRFVGRLKLGASVEKLLASSLDMRTPRSTEALFRQMEAAGAVISSPTYRQFSGEPSYSYAIHLTDGSRLHLERADYYPGSEVRR